MSVAIRAITRLQDADDAPSLGAGQDGYALIWDNASGAFVATALSASGLAADGSVTGATAQAQAFTNGVITGAIKPAANSTTALQLQNAAGTSVLNVDTTNGRVGIGTTAPTRQLHIKGDATSSNLVFETTGYTTKAYFGHYQGATAQFAINRAIDGAFSNTSAAAAAMHFVGLANDSYIVLGTSAVNNTSPTERVRIIKTGEVGIGTAAPGTLLHGLLVSAATNAVKNVVTIGHDTSGTAAAGFGAGLLYQLESSTTAAQSAAHIQALWYEATHATRKADLVLIAYDTADREGIRIRGAGSAPAIGFLGATPAARQAHVADPTGGGTVDAEARSAINSILATLETFGFHATS